jgi:hypothetical protein
MGRGACFSLYGQCDVNQLESISGYSPFSKLLLACSLCEVTAVSSMASTAVSSADVAVVGSGEVGRYDRYNNGPRTVPWSAPPLNWQEFCVLIFNL